MGRHLPHARPLCEVAVRRRRFPWCPAPCVVKIGAMKGQLVRDSMDGFFRVPVFAPEGDHAIIE